MYNIRKLSVNTVYFDFGECVFVCIGGRADPTAAFSD